MAQTSNVSHDRADSRKTQATDGMLANATPLDVASPIIAAKATNWSANRNVSAKLPVIGRQKSCQLVSVSIFWTLS